jgi:hypothetical protein
MDMAFLGAGALGGVALVAALVIAIIMDGGKVGRQQSAATATRRLPAAAPQRR